MSIKLFTGLGTFSHPFDVEGQASSAVVEKSAFFGTTNATIVVDHVATPVLGNINNQALINRVFPTVPSSVAQTLVPSSLPAPLSSNPNQVGPGAPSFTSVTPAVDPQVMSQESGPATYDTLYHDFDIDCFPTYNFWVADEETNDTEDAGDRKLEDIPRFNRVVWDAAPDISKTYMLKTANRRVRTDMQPVIFGSEMSRPTAVNTKGITFTPEHLNNFKLVKQSLANGHISPGTVHAVVELPHNTSGLTDTVISTEPFSHIDEDAFLQHPDFVGMSIEELKANVHSLTNGVLYAGKVNSKTMSTSKTEDKDNLFSGKFSVEKPPMNGGFMYIQSVHSSSPPLSIMGRTAVALESRSVSKDPVLEMVQKVQAPAPSIPDSDAHQIRANFIMPSLGGMLQPEKVNTMQAPHHAENVAALSQFLPNLEVMSAAGMQNQPRQIDIPSFPSPPGLPYLEYTGYVLEKYERNDNGAFVLKETIDLDGRDYSTYIDSKIKYSGVYRYRIRAIMRWTRPGFMGVDGVEPTLGAGFSSQTKAFSSFKSSYFHSEWSKTWAYGIVIDTVPPDPPDELTVRPDSVRKQIVVNFKLPLNEQRDIYYMRLFRKLQDENGVDLTGWVQVGSNWGPENVLYFDSDVDFFQNNHIRYVYAAQTVTRHDEYSPLSEQLATRLNKDYITYGEYQVDFVSQPGVKLEHHGAFGTYPFKRFMTELVVPNDAQFTFTGREANGNIALDGNQYFVRLESLDTGETRDYAIKLVYNNQATMVDRKTLSIFAPGFRVQKTQQVGKTNVPPPVFRDWTSQKPLPKAATNMKQTSRRVLMSSGIK